MVVNPTNMCYNKRGEDNMGLFITFEGQEGAGKSTQSKLLLNHLNNLGHKTILVRDPGGVKISEQIRNIIMDKDNEEISAKTEALLFAAARMQMVKEVIRPHLEQNYIVIADRFADSTIAYQAFGNEINLDDIKWLCKFSSDSIIPDITFFLRIDPEQGLKRKEGEIFDRIENHTLDFHKRVAQGYDYAAKSEPNRIITLDANEHIDTIFGNINKHIETLLKGRS